MWVRIWTCWDDVGVEEARKNILDSLGLILKIVILDNRYTVAIQRLTWNNLPPLGSLAKRPWYLPRILPRAIGQIDKPIHNPPTKTSSKKTPINSKKIR